MGSNPTRDGYFYTAFRPQDLICILSSTSPVLDSSLFHKSFLWLFPGQDCQPYLVRAFRFSFAWWTPSKQLSHGWAMGPLDLAAVSHTSTCPSTLVMQHTLCMSSALKRGYLPELWPMQDSEMRVSVRCSLLILQAEPRSLVSAIFPSIVLRLYCTIGMLICCIIITAHGSQPPSAFDCCRIYYPPPLLDNQHRHRSKHMLSWSRCRWKGVSSVEPKDSCDSSLRRAYCARGNGNSAVPQACKYAADVILLLA